MSENIKHISDGSFETDVLKSDKPVLVDFWAEWCGPCKMIAPMLDEIAGEYQGRVKIAKLNIDENQPNKGQACDDGRIGVGRGELGETVIDAGSAFLGSIAAGLRIAEICMGGLGTVDLVPSAATPRWPRPWRRILMFSRILAPS